MFMGTGSGCSGSHYLHGYLHKQLITGWRRELLGISIWCDTGFERICRFCGVIPKYFQVFQGQMRTKTWNIELFRRIQNSVAFFTCEMKKELTVSSRNNTIFTLFFSLFHPIPTFFRNEQILN